jgi:hypothetical protein
LCSQRHKVRVLNFMILLLRDPLSWEASINHPKIPLLAPHEGGHQELCDYLWFMSGTQSLDSQASPDPRTSKDSIRTMVLHLQSIFVGLSLKPKTGMVKFWQPPVFDRRTILTSCQTTITAGETTKLHMNHIFRFRDVPQRIISDRGPQFIADL